MDDAVYLGQCLSNKSASKVPVSDVVVCAMVIPLLHVPELTADARMCVMTQVPFIRLFCQSIPFIPHIVRPVHIDIVFHLLYSLILFSRPMPTPARAYSGTPASCQARKYRRRWRWDRKMHQVGVHGHLPMSRSHFIQEIQLFADTEKNPRPHGQLPAYFAGRLRRQACPCMPCSGSFCAPRACCCCVWSRACVFSRRACSKRAPSGGASRRAPARASAPPTLICGGSGVSRFTVRYKQ